MTFHLDKSLKVFHPAAFANRVYGVSASGHGLGEATAKLLATLGASVVLNDIDPAGLERVAHDLEQAGLAFAAVPGDIALPETVERMVDAAQRWGRIDGWVNNAGINLKARVEEQAEADFERVWRVNVLAGWRACQRLAPLMAERGGAIVNISSIMAHQCQAETAAYASSKAAVEGMTRALAVELAPRAIRVNALMVGHIPLSRQPGERKPVRNERERLAREARETWIHAVPALHRVGIPEDVASTVAFLLSDAASFLTGATIAVDGGHSVDLRWPLDQRRNDATVELRRLQGEIEQLKQRDAGQ